MRMIARSEKQKRDLISRQLRTFALDQSLQPTPSTGLKPTGDECSSELSLAGPVCTEQPNEVTVVLGAAARIGDI